ncbi:glycoside hydrolase [Qipengyuania sp. RANM35]|uniref:glycoside hydrolase n=1 Tax=Qipengyuania sp. RANM35 TaxID=3068635 RepID=UPI0034DAF25C
MKTRLPLLALAVLAAGCSAQVGRPATADGVSAFYAKEVTARGIPIRSSAKVRDEALLAARDMVGSMFSHRPELAKWLARNDYRVAIIAVDEALLDLPENAEWKKPAKDDPRLTRCELKHYDARIGALSDRQYWDNRARGIGGERTVGSEEDVLGLPVSRYYGETIFVHEMGHNVLFAIEAVDPALYARVEAAYANALKTGLWLNEYTTTTLQEYWAEGTQFWFDSNKLQAFDGRRILGHEDLAAYDPQLYAALADAYGTNHKLRSDPFYLSELRVPKGPIPKNTAEEC